jgi:hypothetical protein
MAENNDHQNPGAWRILKVVTNPTIPLNKKTQPTTSAIASVAIRGSMTAANPRITRMIPSTKKSFQ